MNKVPHIAIVVSACVATVGGYAVFSWWAVFHSADNTLIGDVVGTWKSFAVAAFAFWLGSSSGGKTQAGQPNSPEAPQDIKEL